MSRLLVALFLALSSLALPSAAHAERWTGDDPTGDVVAHDAEAPDPCAAESREDAPDNEDTDVQRIAVSHRQRVIVLRLATRDSRGADYRSAMFYLDTPGRAYGASFDRFRFDGRALTSTSLDRVPRRILTASCEDASGFDEGAPVARHCREPRVDVTRSTVTLRVPRRCVGNPAWVRVGALAVGVGGPDEPVTFLDSWVPAAAEPIGFMFGALSPKVRVG